MNCSSQGYKDVMQSSSVCPASARHSEKLPSNVSEKLRGKPTPALTDEHKKQLSLLHSFFCGLYCSILSSEGVWLLYCCSGVSKLQCWKSRFILSTLSIVSKFNLTIRFELWSEYRPTKTFLGGHLRYLRKLCTVLWFW